MSVHKAVHRLNLDLQKLHRAQGELKKDQRDLRHDTAELKKDKKAGDKEHRDLKAHSAEVAKDSKTLKAHEASRDAQLKDLDAKKADVSAKLAADTFDYDSATPGVQQNPQLLAQLADLTQRRDDAAATWSTKLDADRKELTADRAAAKGDHDAILKLRREIKHDRAVIKGDKKEVARDHKAVHNARHRALSHLREAEYHMGLKGTNRARRELGLKPVDHVIRPANTNTVRGCAQFLLNSPNVSFWTGLSTGSDRKNLERLAHGGKAYVPATGGWVTPKLSMMQALVDMAKHGRIQINALTGGVHSVGSNHYRGTAVDLDVNVGNTSQIVRIANQHGGYRNFETDHIHLDF